MSSVRNTVGSINVPSGIVLLGTLKGANMNTTADQAISIVPVPKYVITQIIVTNASTNLTLAAGGVYDAASKGGNAVIANTQLYSALTAAGKAVSLTIAAIGLATAETASTLYLSLTTAQGGVATADVYVFGAVLP